MQKNITHEIFQLFNFFSCSHNELPLMNECSTYLIQYNTTCHIMANSEAQDRKH